PQSVAEAMAALGPAPRGPGFDFEQMHARFGGVGVARLGQPVPPSTRDAVLGSDAVLVAGAEEPALDEVMAELDLRARVTRVRFGHDDDLAIVAPLDETANEWAIEQAFRLAGTRTMRLAVVGDTPWNEVADEVGERHEH